MKNWLKLLLVIVIFALISVVTYLILKACGVADLDTLKQIIIDSKQYGIIVFFVLELLMFVFLCFVPVLETGLIVLGTLLFGARIGFLVSTLACIISSCILFIIGDKLGERIAVKLIGKSELERAQDIVTFKSKFLLPIFFFVPGFPDDAICLVAGMTKMKFSYFFLLTTICHAIDVAIICFVGEFIDWGALSNFDILILINVVIIDIYLIWKLQNYLEKSHKNKQKDKNE